MVLNDSEDTLQVSGEVCTAWCVVIVGGRYFPTDLKFAVLYVKISMYLCPFTAGMDATTQTGSHELTIPNDVSFVVGGGGGY